MTWNIGAVGRDLMAQLGASIAYGRGRAPGFHAWKPFSAYFCWLRTASAANAWQVAYTTIHIAAVSNRRMPNEVVELVVVADHVTQFCP